MNGLEKIKEQIILDAKKQCEEIIGSARASAEKELGAYKAKLEEEKQQALLKAGNDASAIASAAESGAAKAARQVILSRKSEYINNTTSKVLEALCALPEGEYFDFIIDFALKNASEGACKAYFNAKDLARLPKDFELVSKLKAKGSECEIAAEAKQISGGIILDYGDIVIDGSFEAIIEEYHEEIKSKLNELIF